MPLASTSSPPSIEASPEIIRSSVVLPAPLRPDRLMRSRRSSLNEMPRSSGSPEMSLLRSEAMMTANGADGMRPRVSDQRCDPRASIRQCRRTTSRRHERSWFRTAVSSFCATPSRPIRTGPRTTNRSCSCCTDGSRSADLNFGGLYDDVIAAGYRVIAIDHRGHGRGPRPLVPFRLTDCADDAAAVMRTLGVAPAIVYGYSMGGAIAQLIAHEAPRRRRRPGPERHRAALAGGRAAA